MLKNIALLGILFFFLIAASFAQKMVAFDKKGKVKRVRYYVGDEISVGLMDNTFLFGQITKIEEKSFRIDNETIEKDSVKYVYLSRDQSALKIFSRAFFTAGAVYFPMVTFNRTINGDRPIVTESAAIISGSLITSSILLNLLTKKKYRISEKRPLKIIDVSL